MDQPQFHFGRVAHIARVASVLAAACLIGCKLDTRPLREPGQENSPSRETGETRGATEGAAVMQDAAPASDEPQLDAGHDSGESAPIETAPTGSQAPAQMPQDSTPIDAGERDAGAAPAPDAGAPPTTQTSTPTMTASKACSRDALRERADAYLQAMASGDKQSLKLHSSVHYTENGQDQMLGLGVWLTRPKTEFARHILDEPHCSSVTEAVVQDVKGRSVLGLRLRYVEDQLLEVEAQVVVPNFAYYEPESIILTGNDPWAEPVATADRTPTDALVRLAEHYFDAAMDASQLPPHAPDCKRRQNGKLMDDNGNCGVAPGSARFEQRRYPVIDEQAGIVTAIVVYRDYLGMYLFKVQRETIQNIEVVGGAMASSSGW
jgi:hypothetical protein